MSAVPADQHRPPRHVRTARAVVTKLPRYIDSQLALARALHDGCRGIIIDAPPAVPITVTDPSGSLRIQITGASVLRLAGGRARADCRSTVIAHQAHIDA
ncbi:hypothetical protein ACRQ4C_05785 [Curtobacterium sp. SP.BCp]|uniref:hypothetical protein n=1 Tax=Curtobacterium sp. SP.BCp TaxID=3435230 RepID=UPI003F73FB4D